MAGRQRGERPSESFVRIAYLEDDAAHAEMVKVWLETVDHTCRCFAQARAFLRELRQESYDLLILDWELPKSSGPEVLRWVREHVDWSIPILFVTHRDNERDIVEALEQGADDYMTKPLSREVTLARINALARRRDAFSPTGVTLQFGVYQIAPGTRTILRAGTAVDLTEREFKLAVMFFNNVGRLLSRQHLLESVWGLGPGLVTRTVDTHISRLRRKLALVPENGWRLKAVYHHGYRLEPIPEQLEEGNDA